MDNLLSRAITGLYLVAVLVYTPQQVLAAAVGLVIGQQPVAASPAQHGLVQSVGQVFPQRLSVASPVQHGSVRPRGQAFASNPAAAF